jgi:hypothetical protein
MKMKKVLVMAAVLVTFVGVNAANAGLAAHWTLDSLAEGTPYGNPAVVAGVDNGALDFDLASHVDLGNDAALSMGTGNVSITAWVKFGPMAAHGVIAGKGIMADDSGYGLIALNTGQVCFQARTPFAYREVYSNDTGGNWVGFANDEQWHHVVGVLEREQVNGTRIYVDGVLQSHYYNDAVSTIGWTHDLDSDTTSFCVGARYSTNMIPSQQVMWYLDGSVDDVQVYDYVLTQDDIDFLVANPGVAIPEPTLLALLGFGAAGLLRRNRRG